MKEKKIKRNAGKASKLEKELITIRTKGRKKMREDEILKIEKGQTKKGKNKTRKGREWRRLIEVGKKSKNKTEGSCVKGKVVLKNIKNKTKNIIETHLRREQSLEIVKRTIIY